MKLRRSVDLQSGFVVVFLGPPPVVPVCPFWREVSPTKIDCRKKGTLILTSLLEDLVLSLRCWLNVLLESGFPVS